MTDGLSFSFRSKDDEDSCKSPTPSIKQFVQLSVLSRRVEVPTTPSTFQMPEHDDDRLTVGRAPEVSHQGARAGERAKQATFGKSAVKINFA